MDIEIRPELTAQGIPQCQSQNEERERQDANPNLASEHHDTEPLAGLDRASVADAWILATHGCGKVGNVGWQFALAILPWFDRRDDGWSLNPGGIAVLAQELGLDGLA